jgi:prepilin signal peptidase PulO-like enzyme (type II secretory pathway)
MGEAALTLPFYLLILCGFVFGACLGSFATALIWRIPRNIPWAWSKDKGAVRSKCLSCNRVLGIKDLIPIISWSYSHGTCRSCGSHIGMIYPLTEVLCGVVGAILFMMFGISSKTILLSFTILFGALFLWIGIRQNFWSRQLFLLSFFCLTALAFFINMA